MYRTGFVLLLFPGHKSTQLQQQVPPFLMYTKHDKRITVCCGVYIHKPISRFLLHSLWRFWLNSVNRNIVFVHMYIHTSFHFLQSCLNYVYSSFFCLAPVLYLWSVPIFSVWLPHCPACWLNNTWLSLWKSWDQSTSVKTRSPYPCTIWNMCFIAAAIFCCVMFHCTLIIVMDRRALSDLSVPLLLTPQSPQYLCECSAPDPKKLFSRGGKPPRCWFISSYSQICL